MSFMQMRRRENRMGRNIGEELSENRFRFLPCLLFLFVEDYKVAMASRQNKV